MTEHDQCRTWFITISVTTSHSAGRNARIVAGVHRILNRVGQDHEQDDIELAQLRERAAPEQPEGEEQEKVDDRGADDECRHGWPNPTDIESSAIRASGASKTGCGALVRTRCGPRLDNSRPEG